MLANFMLPLALVKEAFDLVSIAAAAVYSLLGVLIFAMVWGVIVWLTPFSIRKEIEEDQNTALGVILGAVIIGLALIISAAVAG
jgi:putative membrane protein